MIAPRVDIPMAELAAFARKWRITRIDLFGSALRDDFSAESDVDLLADFAPDASWSLIDHVTMEDELRAIFGRNVDLVSRDAIESSRNWVRRRAILESAQPIYAADQS